ncbi:fumarylacetoacetate hydrolase family protein [Achromobacter xylosoxidans]
MVGAALNYRQQLEALGEAAHAPPYQRPPQAPVLYIKPANTHAQDGDAILVPVDVAEVQVGACLGIVFGRPRASARHRRSTTWRATGWWPTCPSRTPATSGPRSSSSAATASAPSVGT